MARIIDNKRSKKPERKKYITENTRIWRKNNPKKRNAQKLVNNYLRYHKDEKPKKCSYC